MSSAEEQVLPAAAGPQPAAVDEVERVVFVSVVVVRALLHEQLHQEQTKQQQMVVVPVPLVPSGAVHVTPPFSRFDESKVRYYPLLGLISQKFQLFRCQLDVSSKTNYYCHCCYCGQSKKKKKENM